MSKLGQKAELAANILIILAAVLLIGVIVQKYFFSSTAAKQTARLQPAIGSKLNVADVDFSSQSRTLFLALQTGCHFCNESVSFYKRIIANTQNKNIKLVGFSAHRGKHGASKELGR